MLCLTVQTDKDWVREALGDLDAVLVDHAHCEMKAASHALSLATRHLDRPELLRPLTDLAREEIDHFQRVASILEARGVPIGPPPVDEYAAELRRRSARVKSRPPINALVDRLLAAALIEARSCERFKLIADALGASHELHAFYTELFAAEARHYRTFVDLAVGVAGSDRVSVEARLQELAEVEGSIVQILSREPKARIHG